MAPFLLLLLLPAVLAIKHDPPLQLINTIVVTKEGPLAFDTQLVTSSSWSSGRLPPHTESSLVACASTCSRRNRETLGSCTALVYSAETKDCHLGTATVAELGQQGEVVYVMKGAGGVTSTTSSTTTTTTTTTTTSTATSSTTTSSTTSTTPTGGDCVLEPNTDMPGSGLAEPVMAGSTEACSMLCHKEAACNYWTFGTEGLGAGHWAVGFCWLKSGDSGRTYGAGFTSGSRACGAPAVDCQDASTKGQDYRGPASTTEEGIPCQAWSATSPHVPTAYDAVEHGLEANSCRNPVLGAGEPMPRVWCYTTDSSERWQYCGVPHCPVPCGNLKEIGFGYHQSPGSARADAGYFGPPQTEESCAGHCREDDDCRFWTFKPSYTGCYLSTLGSGREAYHDRVSGQRPCN